jgi:tetratricopeptide (TPR) repeat protein
MNRHCAEFFLIALVLASALILPPLAWSQQNGGAGSANVSGTVYMEKDNRPIFSAYVRLCDAGGVEVAEMFTSDSGEFAFHGIAPAKYTLQISALGFETITLDVDLAFVSDRGVPVYLKPVAATTTETAAGASSASVSVHELSLPQAARDAFAAGKKKMYVDKNLSGALADFQAAVTAAPGYYEAYYQMALAHLTLGNSGDAEANLRKSIAASGDKYGEAEVGLGTVLLDRGQSAEAEKALRRGVELNPNLWLGHYELGRSLFNLRKDSEALKSAERARALSPASPIIYRLFANIHLRAQDYPAVLADIDQYLKLDPQSAAGIRAKQLREQVAQKVASGNGP